MKKFTFLFSLVLALSLQGADSVASAQTQDDPAAIPLYPDRPVSSKPETVQARPKNLDDRGLNRAIRDISTPTLTIYRPEVQDEKRTAIVICPGGGYANVVIDREGHAYARFLQKHGITAVVLKYRLPTVGQPIQSLKELPIPQQDALAAIRYVRENAQKLNISPNRIGIIGSSAGGHLAGSMAMLTRPGELSRPDFIALLYPVTRMDEEKEIHKGSRDRLIGENPSEELVNQYTLCRQVRADMPPHFIVHATNDKVVPISNATTLAEALIQAKVPLYLSILPEGGHGFSVGRPGCPLTFLWGEQLVTWLKTLP